MENKIAMSEDVKNHLIMNASTDTYRGIPGEYEKRNGVYGYFIEFERVSESHIKMAEQNLRILGERVTELNKREGPRVGDYLQLPHGMYTRFTYDWGDRLQIGGSDNGSYHLSSNGYISYSGSLDEGVEKKFMTFTGVYRSGRVWLFSEGWAGGGRGVYFCTDFRVFQLTNDFDPAKLWQVKNKEAEIHRSKAEKITRTDGNGNAYTLPLPEIMLIGVSDKVLAKVEEVSGLKFSVHDKFNQMYKCQPLKRSELEKVLSFGYWVGNYYNNCTHHNKVVLLYKSTGPSVLPSLFY